MSRRVAIPVEYQTARLHLEKGRRWSVVEHLLIFAVKEAPATTDELSSSARLPYRVVLESMINLMRVGWVEIEATGDRVRFAITRGGLEYVDRRELPIVTQLLSRPAKFATDLVQGRVLRWRELTFVPGTRMDRMTDDDVVRLRPARDLRRPRLAEILDKVLEEDETFRGMDSSASRPGHGWILASVVGDRVEGLPRGTSEELLDEVRSAARRSRGLAAAAALTPVEAAPVERVRPLRDIHFAADDLVTGGEEHRLHLMQTLEAANAWVVIHSTFLRQAAFDELLPAMERAVRQRGVRIDVFYGKGSERVPDTEARQTATALQRSVAARELQQSIRIHQFSTGSHAKLIVADDGAGRFRATVGSCNWLYSGFDSFEVSVTLADPEIVADVMDALADMAFEATGDWAGVTADLAGRGRTVRASRVQRQGLKAKAQLVLGREHEQVFAAARDHAKRRILVASHRLGAAARTMVVLPFSAATMERGLDTKLLYATPSDRVTPAAAADMTFDLAADAVGLRQITDPRMHAKFMVWDDNDLLVTSQNLLSGNPTGDFEEVGVRISGVGVGRQMIDRTTLQFPALR